jgi:hypothetical protein
VQLPLELRYIKIPSLLRNLNCGDQACQ